MDQVTDLGVFGTLHTDEKGAEYLQIAGLGIHADTCKPFRAIVAAFNSDRDSSGWHKLEVKGVRGPFRIAGRWVEEHGGKADGCTTGAADD
jgi:hypothetical protein